MFRALLASIFLFPLLASAQQVYTDIHKIETVEVCGKTPLGITIAAVPEDPDCPPPYVQLQLGPLLDALATKAAKDQGVDVKLFSDAVVVFVPGLISPCVDPDPAKDPHVYRGCSKMSLSGEASVAFIAFASDDVARSTEHEFNHLAIHEKGLPLEKEKAAHAAYDKAAAKKE